MTLGGRKNSFSIITGLKADYMGTNIKSTWNIVRRRKEVPGSGVLSIFLEAIS